MIRGCFTSTVGRCVGLLKLTNHGSVFSCQPIRSEYYLTNVGVSCCSHVVVASRCRCCSVAAVAGVVVLGPVPGLQSTAVTMASLVTTDHTLHCSTCSSLTRIVDWSRVLCVQTVVRVIMSQCHSVSSSWAPDAALRTHVVRTDDRIVL